MAETEPAMAGRSNPIRQVARGPIALRTSTVKITRSVRLLLAVIALLAVAADPDQPVRYPTAAYGLLFGYVLMAAALLALSYLPAGQSPRLALGAHILDLVILSSLNVLTAGPTSPYFLLLTFVLLNATIRWRWRGAVLSGAALLSIFVALALLAGETTEPERDRVIIRAGYLIALTLFLSVMGGYQERLSSELTRLAAPDFPPTSSLETAHSALLAHAAGVFQAARAILVWSEDDEPWLHVLDWSPASTARHREPPDELEPLVPDELADKSFWAPAAGTPARTLIYHPRLGYLAWKGSPIASGLQQRFGLAGALSAPIDAEGVQGRLFVSTESDPDPEDLVLISIIARQAAGYIDQVRASERLRHQSAVAERLRIARDLHDGILQFLTGIRLQLESVPRTGQSPAELRSRLSEIQRLISAQQREVRAFVQTLKPLLANRVLASTSLSMRFDAMTRRLIQTWRVDVQMSVEPSELEVSAQLADEIVHIVSEAVANAARHGAAKSVVVQAQRRHETLLLKVADNGSGFGFCGRCSAADLAARDLGPVLLRERVAVLGGLLAIESGPAGATVEIILPLERQ